jgi:hypothetical protein
VTTLASNAFLTSITFLPLSSTAAYLAAYAGGVIAYHSTQVPGAKSRNILAAILAGVPDDEQAKIAGGNTARVYNFDVARLTIPA